MKCSNVSKLIASILENRFDSLVVDLAKSEVHFFNQTPIAPYEIVDFHFLEIVF